MAIDFTKTTTLLGVVEQNYPPNTVLVDTFFPLEDTFTTDSVQIEYRKGSRMLAPYIVPGGHGVNMARTGSTLREYTPPMTAPKRPTTVEQIMQRGFGETIYSPKTPAQRAAELMARDLIELTDMNIRRQEYMAAQLLTTGQCVCEGYADDGTTELVDTFILDGFTNKVTKSDTETWDNAGAKILDHIADMSETITDNANMVPTVAFMARNVAKYMLNNKQIMDYLAIPSRDNLRLMNFAPQIVNPAVTRFGYIEALNLDLYVYSGGYTDKDGTLQRFIPDDYFIMGIKGKGRRLYGAITQLEDDHQWHSYAGKYIPRVYTDIQNDIKELRVASRCIMIPESVDDFGVIKVK